MGGAQSTSSATLKSNNVVVNEAAINSLNQTISTSTTNSMVETAKSCSAGLTQDQTILLGDITVSGGSSGSITQSQASKLNFNCLQDDKIQMQIIQPIINTINDAIQNNASTDLINKLNAQLKNKTSSDWGALPWGGSTTNTTTNQSIKNYVSSKTNVNIKNAVENSVFANFKTQISDGCIAKVIQNQKIAAGNLTISGGSKYAITQMQNAELLASCVQQSNIVDKVIKEVTSFAGLNYVGTNTTSASNTATAEVESSAVNTGFFQGIGSAIESVGKSIGSIVQGLGFGLLVPFAIPISICCIILCCCICSFFLFSMGKGGGGESSNTYAASDTGYSYESQGGSLVVPLFFGNKNV